MTSSPQLISTAVEMRSSGPWPETEINTASGDEANSFSQEHIKTSCLHRLLVHLSYIFATVITRSVNYLAAMATG